MKFEEWYDSVHMNGDRRTAETIWETCKQECLKVIHRYNQNHILSYEKLIDEVEKNI
jgi:NAD-dependent dihydropyrimidine dehydrogenase PreA subunit